MRKIRFTALFGFLLLACLIFPAASYGEEKVDVFVDNVKVEFKIQPFVTDGTTMVQFKPLFEKMGLTVKWDGATNTVTGTKDGLNIQLVLNQKKATINGKPFELRMAPYTKDGSTLIPLYFVGEATGAKVTYDQASHRVTIETKPAEAKASAKLTVEDIGAFTDRVVLIEMYDPDDQLVSTGSGFILSADGSVATNHHVIEDAAYAKVILDDDRTYTTKTITRLDKANDLAVIKIPAKNLPFVKLGDSSKVKNGENVVAIGSPLGMKNTLSTGIVSSANRMVGDKKYIQISVPIDHGSSGGALFNMYGEVIGVTSAGYDSRADLNLAIPVNTLKTLLAKPAGSIAMVGKSAELDLEEVADYLYERNGQLTYRDKYDFDFGFFATYEDDDLNIAVVMENEDQFRTLLGLQESGDDPIGSMLYKIADDVHEEFGGNVFVHLFGAFEESPNYPEWPSAEVTVNADGTYEVFYAPMSGYFDYGQREMYIVRDPKGDREVTVYDMD